MKSIKSAPIFGGLAIFTFCIVAACLTPVWGWNQYVLDLGSKVLGADLSPDSNLIAVCVLNPKDLLGRKSDELIQEIQMWDWKQRKLIARRVVLQKQGVDYRDMRMQEQFVRYVTEGKRLVSYQDGHLLLLDSQTLVTIRDIELNVSGRPWVNSLKSLPSPYEFERVAALDVDDYGNRAAVLLRWGVLAGGELRIYDLQSGSLIRRWEFRNTNGTSKDAKKLLGFFSHHPISMTPDGRSVAISLGLFAPGDGHRLDPSEKNVHILDVNSGETTSEMNTGYLAGPVRFIPADPLSLVTVSEDDYQRDSGKDCIKIWQASNGALLHQICNPPTGAHYYLDVTRDGQFLVSYTGHVRCRFNPLGLESGCDEHNKGLRLWNLANGKTIWSSPGSMNDDLKGAGLVRQMHLRLSPEGDTILTYEPNFSGKLRFYQVR